MAGDWIKMGKDLLTHPKVVRMSSALRADRLRTVGGLFAVWCLFDTHSADGQLSGYTPEALDELVGFPGISSAMEAVGWLSHDDEGVSLPRFEEHNGQSAKRRAQETDRKREERKTSAPDADKKRTREEKRREEENSPSLRSGESAKPRAARKCPESFAVTHDLKTWADEHCPNVDLARETAKFRDHTFKVAHSDWVGAWRNWMRKASEYAQPARGSPSETPYAAHMRQRVEQAAGSLAHIVATKAPGQRPREPWEVAADEQRTIEADPPRTLAIGLD